MGKHYAWKRKLAILALSCLVSAPCAWAQAIHIAAIVNDEIITTADIEARRSLIILTSNLPNTPEVQQGLNPRVLDSLINEKLQTQEAVKLSIEVSDAEVEGTLPRIDASRGMAEGSLKKLLTQHPEFSNTIYAQIRAQIIWSKVVERKIKRSINIAQDEIARAQAAQVAAPGTPEVRIAAISIPIRGSNDEARAAKLARKLSDQLNHGADFITLARQVAGTGEAEVSPSNWVAESELQPAMQQALRTLQPKQITQPLRSLNSYQLITLLDRRISKQHPDETEALVKEISVPVKGKSESALHAARDYAEQLHGAPGSCDEKSPDDFGGKATSTFTRATYAQMPPQLRSIVEHLNVGEISDPLIAKSDFKLFMVCERSEPPPTPPPAEEVKRKLFAEKLDLEAEKYLRNLRREAYIDIKGGV